MFIKVVTPEDSTVYEVGSNRDGVRHGRIAVTKLEELYEQVPHASVAVMGSPGPETASTEYGRTSGTFVVQWVSFFGDDERILVVMPATEGYRAWVLNDAGKTIDRV